MYSQIAIGKELRGGGTKEGANQRKKVVWRIEIYLQTLAAEDAKGEPEIRQLEARQESKGAGSTEALLLTQKANSNVSPQSSQTTMEEERGLGTESASWT